jgi:hypothetical protein
LELKSQLCLKPRLKIGSEFLPAWPAEGHVVARDIIFVSIGIYDGGQRLVRFARSVAVIDFDIVYLRATDNLLLETRWNLRPRLERSSSPPSTEETSRDTECPYTERRAGEAALASGRQSDDLS